MYSVILYKRPSVDVPFFQPDSDTWKNQGLIDFYNQLQTTGVLISDAIEFSEDNLVMKKIMTWKSFEDWSSYVNNFVESFNTYALDRHSFHEVNNSQYLINTYLSNFDLVNTTGNLTATITLSVVDNVAHATYTIA